MLRKGIVIAIVLISIGIVSYFFVIRPQQAAKTLDKGIEKYEQEQYEEALSLLNRSLSLKKDMPEALSYKALSLFYLERHVEALETAARLLSIESENTKGWWVRAMANKALEKHEEALDAFNEYILLDSLYGEIYAARGETFLALSDTLLAEADFRQALHLDEAQGSPNYYLAVINLSRDDFESALENVNKALLYRYDSLRSLGLKADVLDSLEQIDSLVDVLYRLKKMGVTSADHYYRIGYNEYQINRHAHSVASLSKAIEAGYDDDDALYYRGTGYVNLQRFDDAIQDYNKIIEAAGTNKNRERSLYNRGLAYIHQGHFERGKQDMIRLKKLTPEDNRVYLSLGIAEARLNNFNASVNYFDQAIDLQETPEAYFYRGVSKGMLDRHDDAIQDYTKAIDIRANYPEALFNRGVSYLNRNRFTEACIDLRKSYELGFPRAMELIEGYCINTGN